jgi:hypothetical protein
MKTGRKSLEFFSVIQCLIHLPTLCELPRQYTHDLDASLQRQSQEVKRKTNDGSEISPRGDTQGSDDDQRALVDGHTAVLRILAAQEANGLAMCDAAIDDSGTTEDKNVGEFAPVFVVAIDNERDVGIFPDISQPFELVGCGPFRLLVDWREEIFAIEGKADWDDVGLAGFVCRSEMARAGGTEESCDVSV